MPNLRSGVIPVQSGASAWGAYAITPLCLSKSHSQSSSIDAVQFPTAAASLATEPACRVTPSAHTSPCPPPARASPCPPPARTSACCPLALSLPETRAGLGGAAVAQAASPRLHAPGHLHGRTRWPCSRSSPSSSMPASHVRQEQIKIQQLSLEMNK